MITKAVTIPLADYQRRDFEKWNALETEVIRNRNITARALIAAQIDPDTLGDVTIDVSHPEVGIVITPKV